VQSLISVNTPHDRHVKLRRNICTRWLLPPHVRHPLFIVLLVFFLIADLRQFQRLDAGHFKITVALQTRHEFAFFEFIFFNINLALALWAHNHDCLHHDFLRCFHAHAARIYI
jgi:hypothetical protein